MRAEIWELDFYSRPVLDENGKKLWELLVCDRSRTKEFSKFCPPQTVNSEWIASQLQELVASWGTAPQKVRFYRPAMHNMLNRGCKLADLTPLPSRRLYALPQWLAERMTLSIRWSCPLSCYCCAGMHQGCSLGVTARTRQPQHDNKRVISVSR